MKTYTVASAIIKYKDKYLIGKRATNKKFYPNVWELISGFIEEKEPAEETILREIKEETKVKAKLIKTADPYIIKVVNERWIIIPFLLEAKNNSFKLNKKDHSELKWVSLEELSQITELKEDIKQLKIRGLLKWN